MNPKTRDLSLAIGLVVLAMLACSPQGVWDGLFGTNKPTVKPTTVAIVTVTVPPTSTPVPPPTVPPTPTPIPPSPIPPPTPIPTPILNYSMLIGRDSQECLTAASTVPSRQRCSGATNQQWALVPVDGGLVQIVSKTGSCMVAGDLVPGSDQAGLSLAACNRNSERQRWKKVMYGDWFQLVAQHHDMCIDVSTFGSNLVFQWACKAGNRNNTLNDNDNQLWLESNVSDIARRIPAPVPPPGVYVTNISSGPLAVRQDIPFSIGFVNTTGVPQNHTWLVRIRRIDGKEGSGDTGWKKEDIPAGSSTLPGLKPWRIGPVCADFTAQVVWRDSKDADVPFRDVLGRKPIMSFRICQ